MSVSRESLLVVDRHTNHRRFGLLLVLFLALAPRLYAIAHTEVIQRDGVTFIRYARAVESDGLSSAAAFDQHIGYPLLLAGVHRVVFGGSDSVESWEHVGQWISLVAGVVATAGLWALTGLAVNWRVAWVAVGLFAVGRKWSMLGADVMSDATMLSFWVWALVAAVLAARNSRRWALPLAALAGTLAALAYLVRPEGAGAALVACGLFLFQALRHRIPWPRTLALLAAVLIPAVAIASLYATQIGGLTKKKDLLPLVPSVWIPAATSPLPLAQVPGPAADFSPPVALLAQTAEALGPTVTTFAAFFLVCVATHFALPLHRRKPHLAVPSGAAGVVIALVLLLYVPILLRLHVRAGYLDWRHCMTVAFVLVPLAGCALVALIDVLAHATSPVRLKSLSVRQFVVIQWCWVYPVLIVAAGYQSFRPLHAGNSYVLEAAVLLDRDTTPNPRLVTNLAWLTHYSHMPSQILDSSRIDPATYAVRLAAIAPPPTHIALSARWFPPGTDIPALIPPGYVGLHSLHQPGDTPDTLQIFRRTPQ